MNLYLMRHGDALPKYEDPERGLSPLGVAQVEAVARQVAGRSLATPRVLHSPKRRAVQTAERVCALAFPEASPALQEGLLPNDHPGAWFDRLDEAEGDLLLVGHNPFMSDLAQRLSRQPMGFSTATFVHLVRRAPGAWDLAWVEAPPSGL